MKKRVLKKFKIKFFVGKQDVYGVWQVGSFEISLSTDV